MKFLSQVYTVARGSVGGVTYTANQWHALIARARVSPVNPQTTNQTAIRSALAQVSGYWKNLSDADRDAWDAYAATCEYQGPIGNYTVPGRQMFSGVLALAKYIEQRGLYALTVTTDPPTIPGFLSAGPVTPSSPASTGTGIGLSVQNFTGEDFIVFVERTFAFNPSRNRYQGSFLSSSAQCVLCANGTSTLVEFMGLEEDYVYFTRVRAITDAAPYRVSAEYITRHVAEVIGV
jgi:hypothetical protein